MKNTYKEITSARVLLELPEQATLTEIRNNYRKLIRKWHPDRCREDAALCQEMSVRLNSAYKLLTTYCRQYKFSFSKAEVQNYATDEEWWMDRFGNDPLWAKCTHP
ncbi:MAG: molecular chaperone DnaJ [Deltaproteobacteria bacterium RIFOXYD12_FULL_50_9]|nr:MAG: molecular chaperone DnaJ [Deltaproteobacteria bacterium RIFOXYD12_FULL_50_9]